MSNVDEAVLRRVAHIVILQGRDLRDNAAHNGSIGDGGGGAMIDAGEAFLAGLERRLPEGWQSYLAQAKKQADPEYAEYQRLKAKFGDK